MSHVNALYQVAKRLLIGQECDYFPGFYSQGAHYRLSVWFLWPLPQYLFFFPQSKSLCGLTPFGRKVKDYVTRSGTTIKLHYYSKLLFQ